MSITRSAVLVLVSSAAIIGGERQTSGLGESRNARMQFSAKEMTQVIAQAQPPGPNGITYYGGPVITSSTGTNLYYIWYGNWSGNSAAPILTDLAKNLGGSPYFSINTTYFDASNVHVSKALNFRGSANDAYSQGTTLSNSQIQAVVSRAIREGLPQDATAVYMVLTSQDVVPPSFCSGLCGNYGHFVMGTTDIKYGWVGDANRCPKVCAPTITIGPNGNVGADAMASTVSHELINAITNSDRTGWHDSRGRAPASICATPETAFPVTYLSPNGARASVRLGARDYFIQTNWVNANGGYCAMQMK